MKNKISKKGFTLVELLAVIVILAVIAVIAVPQVLKIIETSRQDAFKASIRSAIKQVELKAAKDTTGGDLTGNLSELDISNNPFKGGNWYYDSASRKVIIFEARDNASVAQSKYVITGDKEEVNSGNLVIAKPLNTNTDPNLLASKMNDDDLGADGTIITSGDNRGYIQGADPNNYVCLDLNANNTCDKTTDATDERFRIVKVFEDKSVLIVKNTIVANKPYYTSETCYYDWETDESDYSGCQNNFAKLPIKDYLNTEFYNTITNKSLIKYNNWDTSCYSSGTSYGSCPDNGPRSIMSKVGLLTLEDYLTVAGVGVYQTPSTSNYLITGEYWLVTGFSSDAFYAWIVDGIGYADTGSVGGEYGARPAVVLNSGITITGGNGSLNTPYTVE